MKRKPPKEIREHWERVAAMGCLITGSHEVQLHHCKGGSMVDAGYRIGTGQKPSDWLVIPINWQYHTGSFGIHTIGVRTWEELYGTQISLLHRVSIHLGYDVREKAND